MFTLIDEDAVLAWDDLPGAEPGWLDSFYPGFLANSRMRGKTWGIPFQRSTIVLYWNKEALRAASLDPERASTNGAEQLQFAQCLTRREGDNVTQWGIQNASSGFPYWLFQGLTTQHDVLLANQEGNRTFFGDPKVAQALRYWMDLSQRHRVHPRASSNGAPRRAISSNARRR